MVEKKIGFKCVDFKSLDTLNVTNSFNNSQTFTFDRVYDDFTNQYNLYVETAKPLITDILKGYNGTIFTYGQSGSGKTYTMYGGELLDSETQGIIPRAINEIFEYINSEENKEIRFELKFSMLEIYQEQLYDLLNPDTKSQDLKIKEHSKKGIYVENLSEVYISSQEEFLVLIHEAERCRIVKETGLNKCSSRSHLLFQLQITQKFPDDTEKHGSLNLIDLAGSEKVSKTHAIGETLNEAKKINTSLSILGKVISILASNTGEYVPYRESKLTRILQDSLGGNSKTILIVNCSIHSYNSDETTYTLNFAKRAKKIKNKVKINIKHSAEQLEALIEILTNKLRLANEEINKLRGKSTSVVVNENEERNYLNINKIPCDNSLINNLFASPIAGCAFINCENVNNSKVANENLEDVELIKDLNRKLNKKDEEISVLNEKLDILQQENKILQEKIENVKKQNRIESYIESLDKSLKENLENLKQIFLINKKEEIESMTQRMREVKKLYEDCEKNYMKLFKKLTVFRDVEFDDKINIIINDNFSTIVDKANEKYCRNNNYNFNIKNFNNINNITVIQNNNNETFINEKDDFDSSKLKFNSNINYIKYLSNDEKNRISDKQKLKNNPKNEYEASLSEMNNNQINTLSFEDPDSVVNFVNPANKESTSPNVIMNLNNTLKKNYKSNKTSNNKIPTLSENKTVTYRKSIKKTNNMKKNVKNQSPSIPNPDSQTSKILLGKEENCSRSLLPIQYTNENKNNNKNDNFDDFIKNGNSKEKNLTKLNSKEKNKNKIPSSNCIPKIPSFKMSKKNLVFESSKNIINDDDFKKNIISEAVKKARNDTDYNFEIPDLEFEKEDNNDSLRIYQEISGNLYNYNFHCEELFKKIEILLNSKDKSNESDLIIHSYKSLFLSNKIFSLKIFDEFLKKKEDYKIDLINNLHQKSYENLLTSNFNTYSSPNNNFNNVNNMLFSPESKKKINENLKKIKEDYFMSPKSESKNNNEENKEKVRFNNTYDNNVNNKKNIYFDSISHNNNQIDTDNFLRMKNCLIKLMLKIIYYENFNYDLLNKLSIDLSKYSNIEFIIF